MKNVKNLVKLIEIPAVDFVRAVHFYEAVFERQLHLCDCDETEKMAFFSDFSSASNVAISWSADFRPSADGLRVSLEVEALEPALQRILSGGGKVVQPKTKIQAEGLGYFATFVDSEGNTLGLYADR